MCNFVGHAPALPSVNGTDGDHAGSLDATGPSAFGNDLALQVMAEGRDVPRVVTKCIAAVDAIGTLSLSSFGDNRD